MAETLTDTGIASAAEDQVHRLVDGRLEVNPSAHTTLVDGMPLDINGTKLKFLTFLASRADHTVPLPNLCMEVWGYDDVSAQDTARVHISQLRKALGEELGDPKHGAIRTRVGLGYQPVSSLNGNAVPRAESPASYLLADDRITVDPEALTVRADGNLLGDLTRTQFRLFAMLARRPGKILGLPAMGTALRNYDEWTFKNNAIRVHIKELRHKLGPELGHVKHGAVRTKTGIGYYAVSSLAP